MKTVKTLLLFAFAISNIAAQIQAEIQTGYRGKVYVDAEGNEHRYVVFVPHKIKKDERPALMLFLHGSGERGDNGLDQIMVGLGPALWKVKRDFPFVVVFPQCQKESRWDVESPDAQRALAMLKLAAKEYETDPDRVYLTGLSMGGSGAWSIAAKHPTMFSAIVPMCSRPAPEIAGRLADSRLPIWNFCGDADKEDTVKANRVMHKALFQAGANPTYTEYPGVGHNCWDNAYGTAELYTWMLQQRRSKNATGTGSDK